MSIEQIINNIKIWITTEGVKLLFALLILYVSFKLIDFFSKRIEKKLYDKKRKIDETISRVALSILRKGLKFFSFVCFLSYVGVETSAIAAAITSTGLAIGLALQGSLANFAGGVIILIMHPYKINDYIKINDIEGTVEDIKLFYTYIVTIDNKVVVVPNGKIADSSITNYSSKKYRRLDLIFKISYVNDIEKAKEAIMMSVENFNNYNKNIKPLINVYNYENNTMELFLRVWCLNNVYWDFYYYLKEEVKKQFDENHIKVPYEKLQVDLNK